MQDFYALSERALQHGYRLQSHESVTSTNQLAITKARQGDAGRLWIVANEQTQGVGRRGRAWYSPAGNLYASLLLVTDFSPEQAATLGFVAGVAMAEALREVTQNTTKIRLKWPNDVLFDGEKITGILVERLTLKQGMAASIIGIGINVVHAPLQANYPVTSLKTQGLSLSSGEIFTHLSAAWAVNFDLWEREGGFESIQKKWLEFGYGLGEKIHVIRQGKIISGIFKTIDATGQLVIKTEGKGEVTISAGDVHFGDAATWHFHKNED